MKRLSILICIVCVVFVANAQTTEDTWKQHSRHELTLGFSDPTIQSFLCNADWEYSSYRWQNEVVVPEGWFARDCYRARYGMTLPITLTYRYRLAKWFWIGGAVSYYGVYSTYHDRFTDEIAARTSTHLINISPTLHFTWLNRKYVTVYSGLSGGYSLFCDKSYSVQHEEYQSRVLHGWNCQITAIGIKAGKKWFGFAEAGIGTHSFITAGFGYRFNEND